ncbi:MAG: L-seryl-tRNA(Ser) seleniumtransferase, partial [Gaiellales bacterium]|nr:L-seryl-tRNA(Ser) seleniumtransferase [Gaiellales bacterium]
MGAGAAAEGRPASSGEGAACWSPRVHPTIGFMTANPLRDLPSVDALLRTSEAKELIARHGRQAVVGALRETLAATRASELPRSSAELLGAAEARLETAPSLRRVLNATGVIVHTNLGRAPLAQIAIDAMRDAAGTVSVEYDLERGTRGERHGHLSRLLAEVTGAEDAVVANNGAAAVLLA